MSTNINPFTKEKIRHQLVGLKLAEDDEKCIFCGNPAHIYITMDMWESDMNPACNNCVGPGPIGSHVELITDPKNIPDFV